MRPQPVTSNDFYAKRRGRNIAVALALAALVVLFFVVSMVKMRSLEGEHMRSGNPASPAADR